MEVTSCSSDPDALSFPDDPSLLTGLNALADTSVIRYMAERSEPREVVTPSNASQTSSPTTDIDVTTVSNSTENEQQVIATNISSANIITAVDNVIDSTEAPSKVSDDSSNVPITSRDKNAPDLPSGDTANPEDCRDDDPMETDENDTRCQTVIDAESILERERRQIDTLMQDLESPSKDDSTSSDEDLNITDEADLQTLLPDTVEPTEDVIKSSSVTRDDSLTKSDGAELSPNNDSLKIGEKSQMTPTVEKSVDAPIFEKIEPTSEKKGEVSDALTSEVTASTITSVSSDHVTFLDPKGKDSSNTTSDEDSSDAVQVGQSNAQVIKISIKSLIEESVKTSSPIKKVKDPEVADQAKCIDPLGSDTLMTDNDLSEGVVLLSQVAQSMAKVETLEEPPLPSDTAKVEQQKSIFDISGTNDDICPDEPSKSHENTDPNPIVSIKDGDKISSSNNVLSTIDQLELPEPSLLSIENETILEPVADSPSHLDCEIENKADANSSSFKYSSFKSQTENVIDSDHTLESDKVTKHEIESFPVTSEALLTPRSSAKLEAAESLANLKEMEDISDTRNSDSLEKEEESAQIMLALSQSIPASIPVLPLNSTSLSQADSLSTTQIDENVAQSNENTHLNVELCDQPSAFAPTPSSVEKGASLSTPAEPSLEKCAEISMDSDVHKLMEVSSECDLTDNIVNKIQTNEKSSPSKPAVDVLPFESDILNPDPCKDQITEDKDLGTKKQTIPYEDKEETDMEVDSGKTTSKITTADDQTAVEDNHQETAQEDGTNRSKEVDVNVQEEVEKEDLEEEIEVTLSSMEVWHGVSSALATMRHLRCIVLAGCDEGCLDNILSHCHNITKLHVTGFGGRDSLLSFDPSYLLQASNLEDLYLSGHFTFTANFNFIKLRRLKKLGLCGAQLTRWPYLGTNITHLHVRPVTNFYCDTWINIAAMKGLCELSLSEFPENTSDTSWHPALAQLTQLQRLALIDCSLGPRITFLLKKFTKLRSLVIKPLPGSQSYVSDQLGRVRQMTLLLHSTSVRLVCDPRHVVNSDEEAFCLPITTTNTTTKHGNSNKDGRTDQKVSFVPLSQVQKFYTSSRGSPGRAQRQFSFRYLLSHQSLSFPLNFT